MYIVGRNDLNPGLLAAQMCHAIREWSELFPDKDKEWYNNSNYIILCCVKNKQELEKLIIKAELLKISVAIFREPDLNDDITAVVFEPGSKTKKLCSKLKLAFS